MTVQGPPAAATSLTHERAALFFEGGRRLKREIVTPEGVAVTVEVGDYGERLIAFTIDVAIWVLLTLAVYIPIGVVIGKTGGGSLIAVSIMLFFGFLVRNLYFVYFELTWRGMTPGKRITGLRVIDRNGGPLVASAVIARNITREVEMFIPLGVLVLGNAADLRNIATAGWLLFFLVLPLTNRDRMRGGDLIAGTMVIALPKRQLLSDLVDSAQQFSFKPAQLQTYGAFELQVLEELLRRPPSRDTTQVLDEVCGKICRKIGWTDPVPPAKVTEFLRDFYAAERAFLEREQLFGKARADKYASPAPRA